MEGRGGAQGNKIEANGQEEGEREIGREGE